MLKIRLRRMGATNRASYRVVVSDSRNTPTAAAVEEIGHYDPVRKPPVIEIDRERAEYWMGLGAQATPTVKNLLKRAGNGAAANDGEPEAESAASA
jgi:small subunit ribosomal protein S16